MDEQNLFVTEVAVNDGSVNWDNPIPIGTFFENVFCKTDNGEVITLKHFFDSYKNFAENSKLIHFGSEEPNNTDHFTIWVDTDPNRE